MAVANTIDNQICLKCLEVHVSFYMHMHNIPQPIHVHKSISYEFFDMKKSINLKSIITHAHSKLADPTTNENSLVFCRTTLICPYMDFNLSKYQGRNSGLKDQNSIIQVRLNKMYLDWIILHFNVLYFTLSVWLAWIFSPLQNAPLPGIWRCSKQ